MIQQVVKAESQLEGFDMNDPETIELICAAKDGDAADRALTIGQALKKYKTGVFWAMFLSTSLIMEGYDGVIVSKPSQRCVPS